MCHGCVMLESDVNGMQVVINGGKEERRERGKEGRGDETHTDTKAV